MAATSQLDDRQLKAVQHPASRLLITAPAGSGKTRVLLARVEWLLQRIRASPSDCLVVTFARKASGELRQRLRLAGLSEVPVMTFHAWAYRFLRRVHTLPFVLITDEQRAILLRKFFVALLHSRHAETIGKLTGAHNWSVPFLVREVIHILETLRQFGVSLKSAGEYVGAKPSPLTNLLVLVWEQYEKLLERRGVSDFAMLLQNATKILDSRNVFAHQPRFILVDEAQDASQTELDLLQRLVRADTNVTLVGDPNQAVYAWRGAVPLTYEAEHAALTENYRSDANVIAVVNHFLERGEGKFVRMRATQKAQYVPQIIFHERYQESVLVEQCLNELGQLGYCAKDLLVLARAHAPLLALRPLQKKYGVRLATVHAAKGLEALVVILLDCSDDRFGFPLPRRPAGHQILADLASYDQPAEERRLFYVAMTRARERLILLADHAAPSSYLRELPKQKVRRVKIPKP